MKVVWICGFSNSEVRKHLRIRKNPLEPLALKIIHRNPDHASDAGVWISNGIDVVRDRNDIELHIITPCRDLVGKKQEFKIDGIHYHFLRDENSGLASKVIRFLFTRNSAQFKKNRREIYNCIERIQPDIVHVIGAENPFYSLALLDIPKSIPTILQLQALLASLEGKVKGDLAVNFAYKGDLEKSLIRRADYIGTTVQSFIDFIRANIKPDARIINTSLAMAQKIDLSEGKKEYTFVHYASGLSTTKASDVALKAFISAHKVHPEITLDVIGAYSGDFKAELDAMIEENKMEDAVKFEGRLPTHDDVIRQIRKARFALLPLKTDIVPNTLREAMANGLPLLTTVTPGTPSLNDKRESALISPVGDTDALSRNMIRLLEDPALGETLRQNAALTEEERASNAAIIGHWLEVYQAILKNRQEGTAIPSEWLL